MLLLTSVVSCGPEEDETRIMTVNGPILPSEMGTTLIHEHVMVDWIGAGETGYHRWDRDEVVERVLPYMQELSENGVQTFIECTPAYLGRDPYILQELSEQTGVQILTNTGYYGAVDNTYMPAHAYEESTEEIARRWIDEYENGIDGSELRPGFIKISVGEEEALSDLHRKIVQAGVITHKETGLTIVSHTIGDQPAMEQIELLKAEGVAPSAWVWTHAQSGSQGANIRAAEEGAWISLDNVHYDPSREAGEQGSVKWYADRITEMKEAGLLEQVLISHDAGFYEAGEPEGGDFRGYTDIFEHLVPELIDTGFTEEEIRQLLEVNPARAYGIRVRSTR